jgi:geranylgeranyl pyrophosphate synthase
MAADLVAGWKTGGVPAEVKSSAGLRQSAETLVRRAGAAPEHVGWTMVTIVSEHWRGRLATGGNGRRLLLLPDCPQAAGSRERSGATAGGLPQVCGPACGIATIWSAARDTGWVVESTDRAMAAIGGLLTGQYDGILGVARLADLEKAFGMLPAFSLPVAAVPFDELAAGELASASSPAAGDASCGETLLAEAIDVEWVLGLLGVAGGVAAPVGDYLPLLREAAELFTPEGLESLSRRLGMDASFGLPMAAVSVANLAPLDAAAALGGGFVSRGGKFLRPFVSLAAFDAVRADLGAGTAGAATESGLRDAAQAVAVAIEVFHKASLVHDDIEDADRVRYARPTLHEEVGVASALNVGDYLLGVGYRIIAGLPGVDPAITRDLIALLADAHVRLARGQGAELWWRDAGDKRLTPAESLTMYGLKTSPAFEAAVALGVRLAGPRPEEVAAIGRYALHVGTGFQVLNDLKDWEGDLENDRRAAGDLLGGRPTLMWSLALERLPAPDMERLTRLAADAGRPDATEAEVAACVAEVRGLYERADVFARTRAIVARERAAAAAAVATCRLPRLREVLEFLLDLAVPEQAFD